jgi:mono/diheme cytochrome c family protein
MVRLSSCAGWEDTDVASGRRLAGRLSVAGGFVIGVVVGVLIGGGWLAFGAPTTWPAGLSLALRERRGSEVYNANCASCHGGPTGGAIEDDPPRHNANGHTWHHPDCALRRMVREGSAGIVEVSRSVLPMPPFRDRLSSEDVDAVLAYIKTMWTPGQRQAQASFTREMCFE